MITRPAIYILVCLLLPLFLTSCGSEEPQESVVQAPKAVPPVKPQPKGEEEKKPAVSEAVAVVKKPERNPFQTFIVKRVPTGPTRVKDPLECCEIRVFRVQAVITGIDNPRALVLAPDGKRYSVKKGDRMGTRDGKVIAIEGKSITVKELIRDADGKVVKTDNVVISLPEEKKEGR
jgi:type IV pilus assembly protein PilP